MARKGKSSNKKKLELTSRLWQKKKVGEIISGDFNMAFSGPDGVNLNSTTSGSVIVSSGGTIQSIPDDIFGVVYVYGNAKPQVHEVHQESSKEKPAKVAGGRTTVRKVSLRGSAVGARGRH